MTTKKETSLLEDGMVTFTLDGREETLEATIDAALKLSRAFGGLGPALTRIAQYDVDAYVAVIQAGLNSDAPDLPGRIFRTGFVALSDPVTRYATLLLSGGVSKREGEAPKGKR